MILIVTVPPAGRAAEGSPPPDDPAVGKVMAMKASGEDPHQLLSFQTKPP